jgi:hypothetical protein
MNNHPSSLIRLKFLAAAVAIALAVALHPLTSYASGGSGGGSGGGGGGGGTSTPKVDSIKVSKCFYQAGSGQMLIKAASSDASARLSAYTPAGTYLGEVQNGGGSRYGGTVMGYVGVDPVSVIILSSSGGSVDAPTTPFQI